jgi:cytochrome c-type biogenesis protein CcmI
LTWFVASALMLVAAPFVLWPLIRHWQPDPEAAAGGDPESRRRELEELDLDVAAGRITEREAAERRLEGS